MPVPFSLIRYLEQQPSIISAFPGVDFNQCTARAPEPCAGIVSTIPNLFSQTQQDHTSSFEGIPSTEYVPPPSTVSRPERTQDEAHSIYESLQPSWSGGVPCSQTLMTSHTISGGTSESSSMFSAQCIEFGSSSRKGCECPISLVSTKPSTRAVVTTWSSKTTCWTMVPSAISSVAWITTSHHCNTTSGGIPSSSFPNSTDTATATYSYLPSSVTYTEPVFTYPTYSTYTYNTESNYPPSQHKTCRTLTSTKTITTGTSINQAISTPNESPLSATADSESYSGPSLWSYLSPPTQPILTPTETFAYSELAPPSFPGALHSSTTHVPHGASYESPIVASLTKKNPSESLDQAASTTSPSSALEPPTTSGRTGNNSPTTIMQSSTWVSGKLNTLTSWAPVASSVDGKQGSTDALQILSEALQTFSSMTFFSSSSVPAGSLSIHATVVPQPSSSNSLSSGQSAAPSSPTGTETHTDTSTPLSPSNSTFSLDTAPSKSAAAAEATDETSHAVPDQSSPSSASISRGNIITSSMWTTTADAHTGDDNTALIGASSTAGGAGKKSQGTQRSLKGWAVALLGIFIAWF